MINRHLERKILENLFKGKIIILLGARQVGKTTLLKEIAKQIKEPVKWLNADEADIFEAFSIANTSTELIQLIGANSKIVIIDEAQQVPNIGKKLKLLFDEKPEIQIIATGSSAFDLQNQTSEPLTGRKRTFHLFPISFSETSSNNNTLEAKRLLETRLVYGLYPDVINNPGKEREILIEIANSYLYKDILHLDGIRKPSHIEKLIKALAFQLGNEVNYHELAQTVGNINTETVEKYLDLLEKAFVIFKVPAFNRNLRNEIKKGKKYYFYDNGIRNVLINNFTLTKMRQDKGALWENFLISERLKKNHYEDRYVNKYFWRTHDGAEIDYLEEIDGTLHAFEFKWKKDKAKFPISFTTAYKENTTSLITKENYESFILKA